MRMPKRAAFPVADNVLFILALQDVIRTRTETIVLRSAGEIEVDQSAMTGESLPVKFRRGELCKMGSTVTRGEVEGTVQATGGNTFFGESPSVRGCVRFSLHQE
jgi:cation transport ATPase